MTITTMTLGAALNAGLRRALEHDRKVVIMGEDVGRLGGVFRITDTLQKDFGDGRVIDTPLAESGIVGTAFGMALRGYRPVCEIQFDGFVYPAFDQIVSQVAKIHYRTAGTSGHRSRSAFRTAVGSVQSSTIPNLPRCISRTPRAYGWSPPATPPTRSP